VTCEKHFEAIGSKHDNWSITPEIMSKDHHFRWAASALGQVRDW
jgi:hypothetical protein